jgi:transposase
MFNIGHENSTDNCLSKSTVSLLELCSNCDLAQAVCKILKELKITYKKINKYLVCKNIKIIKKNYI